MKSLMLFLRCFLNELGELCNVDTSLDYEYVQARVESEGMAFLTISLATFCQDFERALEMRRLTPDLFTGFKKDRYGLTPLFLGGFMEWIFDPGMGALRDDRELFDQGLRKQADGVYAIRQLTGMWSKIRLDCSKEKIEAAYSKYVTCEQELGQADKLLRKMPEVQAAFRRLSTILYGDLFAELDRKILNHELVPHHGPGATAEGIVGNQKYRHVTWPIRLERHFPFSEFGRPIWYDPENDVCPPELDPEYLEPGAELPVRVISVPKTQKGPRIIAIEPVAMQYVQQAIKDEIYESVKSNQLLHRLIGFTDQLPNREMAKNVEFATLDLSEASDRVLCQHVELLLSRHRLSREAVFACRSSKADVPGHGLVDLVKFASMGSALTFPLEAMIFLVIVFMGIEEELKHPLTRAEIKSLAGKVRVYGDDIIVPVHYVASVVEALESFGYKVNSHKSFWNGQFRESCGAEYFNGVDVSIVRLRSMFPTQRNHTPEIISTVSFRNQLFKRGFRGLAIDYLDDLIERFIPFPVVEETSPGLGRLSDSPIISEKWDVKLQRPLVRAARVSVRYRSNEIDGEPALMKFFLKKGDLPVFDKNHLLYGGRPVALTLKTGWISPL